MQPLPGTGTFQVCPKRPFPINTAISARTQFLFIHHEDIRYHHNDLQFLYIVLLFIGMAGGKVTETNLRQSGESALFIHYEDIRYHHIDLQVHYIVLLFIGMARGKVTETEWREREREREHAHSSSSYTTKTLGIITMIYSFFTQFYCLLVWQEGK